MSFCFYKSPLCIIFHFHCQITNLFFLTFAVSTRKTKQVLRFKSYSDHRPYCAQFNKDLNSIKCCFHSNISEHTTRFGRLSVDSSLVILSFENFHENSMSVNMCKSLAIFPNALPLSLSFIICRQHDQ